MCWFMWKVRILPKPILKHLPTEFMVSGKIGGHVINSNVNVRPLLLSQLPGETGIHTVGFWVIQVLRWMLCSPDPEVSCCALSVPLKSVSASNNTIFLSWSIATSFHPLSIWLYRSPCSQRLAHTSSLVLTSSFCHGLYSTINLLILVASRKKMLSAVSQPLAYRL